MKKAVIILNVLALIVGGCKQKTTSANLKIEEQNYKSYFISKTEYTNHYKDDTLLVRVEASTSNILDLFLNTDKEEWIYTYDDKSNELLSLKKYVIKKDSSKELFYQEIFSKNKQTDFYLEGNDTVSFFQRYFDDSGNLIEDLYKTNSPSHYKTTFKYNDNNQLIELIRKDYIYRETRVSTFSHETRQDTLIKRLYTNGKLSGVSYTVQLEDYHTVESFYNLGNFLEHKAEIMEVGEFKTEIDTYYDVEAGLPNIVSSVDTTNYLHGKEIENISILTSFGKRKTLQEYDNRGNIISQQEEIWFLE